MLHTFRIFYLLLLITFSGQGHAQASANKVIENPGLWKADSHPGKVLAASPGSNAHTVQLKILCLDGVVRQVEVDLSSLKRK
mgnify:CR=1 FL=1